MSTKGVKEKLNLLMSNLEEGRECPKGGLSLYLIIAVNIAKFQIDKHSKVTLNPIAYQFVNAAKMILKNMKS